MLPSEAEFGGTMTQSFASADPLLVTVVLATLAIGLPILMVLAIRFLWDRTLNIGRSKELEKLIWQLHRIASALEQQMNLSFPAVQPGTEEPRDLAYLQPEAPAASVTNPAAAAPTTHQPDIQQQQPATPPAAEQPSVRLPALQEPSAETRRAGVNSMFGL
jgi:hypothetical protein